MQVTAKVPDKGVHKHASLPIARHLICSDTFCFPAANLTGEKVSGKTDVDVRPANKLGRDTRKKIVDEALATKDQDQYRFLKLIKDRMDA